MAGVSYVSGRKRIYVDEAEWNRLRQEAASLAAVKRDLPKLMRQVQDQTNRDLERSLRDVDNRQAEFERAVGQLSARTREFEERTAQRLRANAEQLRHELDTQNRQVRAETTQALREQREQLQSAIDQERRERTERLAEIDSRVTALQQDQTRAGELASGFLADAVVLREQVEKFPHERYLPGRFDALDRRLNTVRANVEGGIGAFGLSGAQEICQEFGELRLELEQLDREWRTCRIAAERELVALRELIAQNSTLDPQSGDDVAPDVDHWSRGALGRLRTDVDGLLAQVRDDDQPLTTDALLRIVNNTVPDYEARLESVVGQAVTAIRASQLRTNLAELIADALDQRHHYEVTDHGFAGDDQRGAFLAKTVHTSGSEIVIEVEPGEDTDSSPVVRLHNFDADGASEAERAARTRSIQENIRTYAGIDITAKEEDARPDESKQDVRVQIQRTTTTGQRTSDSVSRTG